VASERRQRGCGRDIVWQTVPNASPSKARLPTVGRRMDGMLRLVGIYQYVVEPMYRYYADLAYKLNRNIWPFIIAYPGDSNVDKIMILYTRHYWYWPRFVAATVYNYAVISLYYLTFLEVRKQLGCTGQCSAIVESMWWMWMFIRCTCSWVFPFSFTFQSLLVHIACTYYLLLLLNTSDVTLIYLSQNHSECPVKHCHHVD